MERFKDKRLLIEAARESKLVAGNQQLAEELVELASVRRFEVGELLIEQDADDNQIFVLISGTCDVAVNGKIVARRFPGDHVGEMAAIQPTQRRSATVVATESVVALEIAEEVFATLGAKYPELYRAIAKELSRRLLQRNAHVGEARNKIRVFIISSVESLEVARAVQNAFEHDPFNVVVWTDGVFKVAHYTLQNLENEVDRSDFAIAIAHPDDNVESRDEIWPKPRDNVIFELGLFMGRLGRERAILMEPRGTKLKLPSDLAGVTTVPYKFEKGEAASIAPACNKLRSHILELGVAVG